MKQNICLVGMMGAGKTTVGEALADRLGMLFIDTDALLEYDYDKIPNLFEKHGEPYFRYLETKEIKRVCGFENTVISSGGGAVLKQENIDYMKEGCVVIFLDLSASGIVERLRGKVGDRPLLKDFSIHRVKQLLNDRYKLYLKAADIVIKCDGLELNGILDKIEEELLKAFS